MTQLNELIEGLYGKAMNEGGQATQLGDTPDTAAHSEHDCQMERVRRTLIEMGRLLSQEEQPQLDEVPPTEEITHRILNHWEQLNSSIAGIKEHMASLEHDITRMQPWGDFDVMKVEKLAERGIFVRFWKSEIRYADLLLNEKQVVRQQTRLIAQDSEWMYFVTIDNEETLMNTPDNAEQVKICPCPVSTLIMLQTLDKDTLRKVEMLKGDYALAHYSEMYAALKQMLPTGASMPQLQPERKGLKQKIRQFFASSASH